MKKLLPKLTSLRFSLILACIMALLFTVQKLLTEFLKENYFFFVVGILYALTVILDIYRLFRGDNLDEPSKNNDDEK